MDDVQRVFDNVHRAQLVAVVVVGEHHGVGETLENGALRLAEPLLVPPPRGVGDEDGAKVDVILQGEIGGFDLIRGPLAKHFGALRYFYHGVGEVRKVG